MKIVIPWLLTVGLAVALVLFFLSARDDVASAAKRAEAAELTAKHFQVAAEAGAKDLAAAADGIAGLKAEVARLQKESPGAKLKTVIRWRTVYLPAGGEARPPETPGAPPPVCVLARGDQGQIRVDAVRAETRAGNVVAIGQAEAVRVAPPPETVLFGGPFEAALSSYTEAAITPAPRWSLGARGWWRNPGWTAEVSGGYRLAGPLWLEGAARFDSQFAAGVRWEVP
jgi:hypothetical protein